MDLTSDFPTLNFAIGVLNPKSPRMNYLNRNMDLTMNVNQNGSAGAFNHISVNSSIN